MNRVALYLLLVVILVFISCFSHDDSAGELENSQILRFEAVDFKGLYIWESHSEVVKIINTGEKDITINKVFLGNWADGTEKDEFKIISGNKLKSLRLKPEHCLLVEISFTPKTLGNKLANLIVYTEEIDNDMIYTLKGLCCEKLEFVTPAKLPDVRYLDDYEVMFEAKGGDGNYTFEIDDSRKYYWGKISRNLPPWLKFKEDKIFGKPNISGYFYILMYVHDESEHTSEKTFELHISDLFADIVRSKDDRDEKFDFREGDDTGQFIVNLEHKGNIPLRINSIELSGSGYDSGEASIVKMPNWPHVVEVEGKVQIIIEVKSKLQKDQDLKLHVKHNGVHKEFIEELNWKIYRQNKYTFILNRSESMSKDLYSYTNISESDGGYIPLPSKWQMVQGETGTILTELREYEIFEILTFTSQVYTCFGQYKNAERGNVSTAIGWVYGQNSKKNTNDWTIETTDTDSSFGFLKALKAAFNNYDKPETIILMTDGVLEWRFNWNYKEYITKASSIVKIIGNTQKWIKQRVRAYKDFKLKIVCMDKKPSTLLKLMGKLPNTSLKIR